MTNLLDSNTKYPISKHGHQCIGPCTKPKVFVVHPISLNYITDKKNPFCPTHQWTDNDGTVYQHDDCFYPVEGSDSSNIETNILIPTFGFSCIHFLKIYYNIYSFESAIEWVLRNPQQPLFTQMRIIDCAWSAFGINYDIDHSIVDFYIDVIKKFWIKHIFPHLNHFITVQSNKILFSSHHIPSSTHKIEKINFILSKLISYSNIYKFLSLYQDYYRNEWNSIISHHINMVPFLINFLTNQINLALK